MYVKEMIKKEIDNLPDSLAAEVYDFIMFLESKKEKNKPCPICSISICDNISKGMG